MRPEPTIPIPNQFDWDNIWGLDDAQPAPISAYVHVPFCRHRCAYCNFSLMANRDDLIDRFLFALATEMSRLETARSVQTIFIGGGTPSLLSDLQTERLCETIRHWLPIENTGEWTIEANPLDITEHRCALWRSLGINRISIGGQSFHQGKLCRLDRDHTPEQLISCLKTAISNFDSVSLDLIFACPDETLMIWNEDLEQAIRSGIQHISTYGLTIEKGAAFWGLQQRGELKALDEDLELTLYRTAIERLTHAGFQHYEISNFAKPEYQCRHNESYWRGRSWWAFGASAARFVAGVRSVNHRGTLEYIRRIEQRRSPIAEMDVLTPEQVIRERLVFGMRQIQGICWSELVQDAPNCLVEELRRNVDRHISEGWMVQDGEQLRLSERGLFVSDSLWREYL